MRRFGRRGRTLAFRDGAQDRANRDGLAFFHNDLGNDARSGCVHLKRDFIGFKLGQGLVGFHGIAVGSDRGLVVPVVRDCDALSVAGIEKAIADYGKRARDGSLKIEEMQGGTFTITNSGIYGSLMSTPILNAPQSGILGMHKIQERPMAVGGKIEIRPMMYLALSYDHRVVDGKEAVTFLVRVKEALEDPARLVLDL